MMMSNSIKDKEELKKALDTAESIEETLKAFKQMESSFEESELGFECFLVATRISKLGNDFEQVLSFGKRALTILTTDDDSNRVSYLRLSRVLLLLGFACYKLGKLDESLGYLNRADESLSMVDDVNLRRRVLDISFDIQWNLCNVNGAMGRREEAVVHAKKGLEIREKMMEKGSFGLGEAYRAVSVACMQAFAHKEALPFCLKALKVYTKHLGSESENVAELKSLLAVIYLEMGEYDKALELNRSAMIVLKKTTTDSKKLMKVEIEGASAMIDLGKYEEAVDVLKGVIACDDLDGDLRLKSIISMGRALCCWGKFADAEKYFSVAKNMLLEKGGLSPMMVAVAYTDLSDLYRKMNNFEEAISLMKLGLAFPGLPQNLLPELCATLTLLIFKDKEEVSYVEDEVEKLKVTFGPKHCAVGYGYSKLGLTYLKSGQMELVAKSFANSKDILDVTLGPHHLTSLKISHGLSVAYAALDRCHLAVEILEKVLEGMKGLDPSELQFMHRVVNLLSDMKQKVAESSKMNEDVCAKISECVISGDEKGS